MILKSHPDISIFFFFTFKSLQIYIYRFISFISVSYFLLLRLYSGYNCLMSHCTILFKSFIFFLFSKDAINWSKVTVKTNLTKDDYFKEMLFFLMFYSSKNPKALFSALTIIRNVSWALTQHIRMISEGSCDTEGCWKFSFAITGINCNKIWNKCILGKHKVLRFNKVSN